tara:strand:- start:238 stop:387 length:150 start_codon:yes stop_codon:yes gene_type:complete
MTIKNSKRLYDHYVEIGYKEAAEDMLNKHPEFSEETTKKEKSDGKKSKR